MDQGEGVEGADRKEDPLDFALWKAQKEARTRPGTRRGAAGARAGTSSARRWPSSCWASSFDIHGGGVDLLFPHHENEAAQTLAARGSRSRAVDAQRDAPARREKMAKSVGNIRGLGDVLDEVGRDALLLYFSGGHYRQPLAYTRERLDARAAASSGSATPGGG
jgi:cysteinyl-tRNA synthetase